MVLEDLHGLVLEVVEGGDLPEGRGYQAPPILLQLGGKNIIGIYIYLYN